MLALQNSSIALFVHLLIPKLLSISYRLIKQYYWRRKKSTLIKFLLAEVKLQSLLYNTATRIAQLQVAELKTIDDAPNSSLTLIGKWGYDGSSGYSEYKQRSENNFEDNNLFVTSYVPLNLITKSTDEHNSITVWKNPRPSSTRFCRPIRFQFRKETSDLAIKEKKYIDQITNLLPSKIVLPEKILTLNIPFILPWLMAKYVTH